MANKLGLHDLDVNGKRVLVRVDFNVPMDGKIITDNTRIRAALPTILQLIRGGAKIILVTHLGRPKGFDPNLSTEPLAIALSKLLGQRVKHIVDCIGVEVEGVVSELRVGDVLLLENIRFYEEETKNDSDFAPTLASLADLYIQRCFWCRASRSRFNRRGNELFRSVRCRFVNGKGNQLPRRSA